MKLKLQFFIAIFIALAILIPAAYGQANLTFSGGSGAPLTVALQQSITYTIINDSCAASGPLVVFDEAGNPFLGAIQVVGGTMSYSINGGNPISIVRANSGAIAADISANDIFVFGNAPGAANMSSVILNAGTFTTENSVAAAAPGGGSFTTFLINTNGVRCSNIISAVTAASVSISGRVLTNNGRGLSNALVYLTDQSGNTQTARANSFGHYRLAGVQAGQIATVTVVSKRYQFAPKVVNLSDSATELDFVAEQ